MAGGEPNQEPKKPRVDRGKSSEGYRFLGLGMELAAAVAGLTLLGYWIDRHFETAPWGVLIGAFVGVVGGLYNVVKTVIAQTGSSTSEATKKSPGAGERSSKGRKR